MDKQICLWYNACMRIAKNIDGRICPYCGSGTNQILFGKNLSGTQKCKCKSCGRYYTLEPKTKAYDAETRRKAVDMYLSGESGRAVGKKFDMSKANVFNWMRDDEHGEEVTID